MPPLKRILLAEDSPQDVEMTLAAMEEYHLANEVVVVRDGAEALDYLYARGKYADLLVLDRDYLTVPADRIKDIRPVMTMIGGRIAYDNGSFSSTR